MLIVIRAGYKKIVLNGKNPSLDSCLLVVSRILIPCTFCSLAVVQEMLFSEELGFKQKINNLVSPSGMHGAFLMFVSYAS
jgi:hypothetical protein